MTHARLVLRAGQPFTGVKVFSAAAYTVRVSLGDMVTEWLSEQSHVVPTEIVVGQSSGARTHCVSIVVFYLDRDPAHASSGDQISLQGNRVLRSHGATPHAAEEHSVVMNARQQPVREGQRPIPWTVVAGSTPATGTNEIASAEGKSVGTLSPACEIFQPSASSTLATGAL